MNATDYLNGVPELLLLHLLARQPRHGYELIQAIKAETGGALAFGEGCIYPLLHRLEARGLLASAREPASERSRVVYRPTPKGLKQLAASAGAWRRVTAAVHGVLGGHGDATPALA